MPINIPNGLPAKEILESEKSDPAILRNRAYR